MTISAYGIGAGSVRRADESFRSLKGSLADLQQQLTTGRKAETYAGLGAGAAASLSARARLASLDAQEANVTDADLRVRIMTQGLEQLEAFALGFRTTLPGSYNQTAIGQTNAQVFAEDGLRRTLDILNSEIAGRYLFSGRAADTAPALPFETLIDGTGGRAGLKQLASERKDADRGPDGMGRLTLTASGTGAILSEEAAGLPFGFKLAGASATGAGLSAALSAGPPAAATVAVTSQPQADDAISLMLDLPDGSQAMLTLAARSPGSSAAPGGFAIGANAADTAANLAAALGAAVAEAGATALASASTMRASREFFAGTATNPPPRIVGPPFATATAVAAGTSANTVVWYAGDAGSGSARETAPVRTGEGTAVAIGARANEPAFQELLASLGALAADSFAAADPTSQARYAALADRVAAGSSNEGIATIVAELSLKGVALGQAADRLGATRNQLQDLLAGAENADPNEVATQLLAVQTRLQASYQTTAAIARLTLVDYL